MKNSLNLNINNIDNKIPIDKLKFFFKIYSENNNNKVTHFCNRFVLEIKQAINFYQYHLIMNNVLEINDFILLI